MVMIAPLRSVRLAASSLPPKASTKPRATASPSRCRRCGGPPPWRDRICRKYAAALPPGCPGPSSSTVRTSCSGIAWARMRICGPGGRVFHRIVQEIDQRLLQQQGIGARPAEARRACRVRVMRTAAAPGAWLPSPPARRHRSPPLGARPRRLPGATCRADCRQNGPAFRLLRGWWQAVRRSGAVIEVAVRRSGVVAAPRIEASGVRRSCDKRGQHRHPQLVGFGQHLRLIHLLHQPGAFDRQRRLVQQRIQQTPLVRREQGAIVLTLQAGDADQSCPVRIGRNSRLAPGKVSALRPAGWP